MKRFPRSRLSSVSLCVVLGLASSACVKPDAASVGMSKVEASLVFGVKEIPKAVVTPIEQVVAQVVFDAPSQVQVATPQQRQGAPVEPEQPFEFAKPAVPKFSQSANAGKDECPEALVSAAPLLAPQPRISGDARPGTSKWRDRGFITTKNFETGVKGPSNFDAAGSPRAIRNFKKLSDNQFTFEEVLVGRQTVTVTTYDVNNNAVSANPSDGVGIVATPGLGEPERGIVITKIETLDKKTGQLVENGKFEPTGAGLLMLPLPVVAGEKFASTAVDPRTGQVISHEATVQERQRIDACGELIDGWGVEYVRRTNGGGSGRDDAGGAAGGAAFLAVVDLKYQTVFATQYGGVPILDRIIVAADQCDTICPFDITSRVAQLNPDPLAAP